MKNEPSVGPRAEDQTIPEHCTAQVDGVTRGAGAVGSGQSVSDR
jgi:hypothetical protein